MSRHSGRISGEGIIGKRLMTISKTKWEQAQLYVLHNDDEVQPYVTIHMDQLSRLNMNRNQNWITREHNRSFITWLNNHIKSKFDIDP